MSRELYNPVAPSNSDARSVPGPIRSTSSRRITELPTVDRSPSRDYPTRRSPSGKWTFFCGPLFNWFFFNHRFGSSMNSCAWLKINNDIWFWCVCVCAATMGSPYYRDMDEPTSPGGAHHRSRSASRPPHSMDYPSKCFKTRQKKRSNIPPNIPISMNKNALFFLSKNQKNNIQEPVINH